MPLTLATPAIGKFAVTAVAKKLSGMVIERWTRHRANIFFEGFVEALGFEQSSATETEEVDKRLTELLADDIKSEVLFDAYRRVCFSKSKTLGPRIIGLLTGQLVLEGRMADFIEEGVFEAAELLSDGDLIDFLKSYREHRDKATGVTDPKAEHRMLGDSVIVRWLEESASSSSSFSNELEIGSFPWEEALGRWAVSLKQCGLLEDRVQQSFRQSNRSHRSEEDENAVSTRVITTITFNSGCARLYELLNRSLGSASSAS